MEIEHCLHSVKVLEGEFLEKEHPGIVDEDIRKYFKGFGAPAKEFIRRVRGRKVLEMSSNPYSVRCFKPLSGRL